MFASTHAFASDFGTTRLRLAGSGSLTHRMEECAKEFNQKNPDKSIMVIGGHTGDGFIRLFDGSAEIAMASRKINENEKERGRAKGHETDGENSRIRNTCSSPPFNPLKELTVEQLRKIFNGEYKNWSEMEPIKRFN